MLNGTGNDSGLYIDEVAIADRKNLQRRGFQRGREIQIKSSRPIA